MRTLQPFILTIFSFLTLLGNVSGQDTLLTWLTRDHKETIELSAYQYRKEWEENGLWRVREFYLDGQLQVDATYLSKERETKQGPFSCYDKQGMMTTEGHYSKGIRTGLWTEWYEGRLFNKGSYLENPSPEELEVYLSTIDDLSKNGDSLSVKDGLWEYYHYNGNKSGEETYAQGKLVSAKYWNADGSDWNGVDELNRMPEFPGGERGLMKYLSKNIKYPKKDKRKGVSGISYVAFTIDSHGEVKDVYVFKSVSVLMDQECLRVIHEMPAWLPGKVQNRLVDVQFNLPVSFKLL